MRKVHAVSILSLVTHSLTQRSSLPVIGAVVLVILLCHRLDLHRIANLRQEADWAVLVAAAALTLPFVLLKALKWHHLLQTSDSNISYTLALRSFLIGMGASLFTPARVGELARIACFPKQRLLTFSLVMVDKFIDISVLLGLFSISLAMLSPWIGLVGFLVVSGFWLLVFLGLRVIDTSVGRAQQSWIAERLRLLHQLPRRLIALNASLACVCFGLMTLQFRLLLSSLQPVGWPAALTLPIILVVSSLPISIMGFGLREGTAALLLSRYGVPMESAVAASFSLFVVNSLLPGLIGIALSPTLVRKYRAGKEDSEKVERAACPFL